MSQITVAARTYVTASVNTTHTMDAMDDPNWVRLARNGTNMGLFKDKFIVVLLTE